MTYFKTHMHDLRYKKKLFRIKKKWFWFQLCDRFHSSVNFTNLFIFFLWNVFDNKKKSNIYEYNVYFLYLNVPTRLLSVYYLLDPVKFFSHLSTARKVTEEQILPDKPSFNISSNQVENVDCFTYYQKAQSVFNQLRNC